MIKTISPIDNKVYVERPYASMQEIDTALNNSKKLDWISYKHG